MSLLEAIITIFNPILFAIAFKREKVITIVVTIIERAISIEREIQKRSHGPMYNSDSKNEAKTLRVITLAIAKL